MEPDDILGAIREAYIATRTQYRDGCLRVGRLIRDYLAAVGKTRRAPSDKRLSNRSVAVLKIAKTVGCTRNKVYAMLYAAMAADLLGDGVVGGMSHTMLSSFSPLLRYKADETWIVIPECLSKARELYAEFVAVTPPTHDEVRRRVNDLFAQLGVRKRRGRGFRRLPLMKTVEKVMDHRFLSKAAPGDVAELCLTMVLASADPFAVAHKLTVDLAKIGKGRDNELRFLYDNAVTEEIGVEGCAGEGRDESIKKTLKHMTTDERASALLGLCRKIKRDKLKVG